MLMHELHICVAEPNNTEHFLYLNLVLKNLQDAAGPAETHTSVYHKPLK